MKELFEILGIICIFVLLFIGLVAAGMGTSYFGAKASCEKYDSYNYVVQFEKIGFLSWGCYILMEDGTRIRDYDFKIDFKTEKIPLMKK